MHDLKEIEEIIGYLPYDNIPSLHTRVDRWGLFILKEIQGIKNDAKRK